MTTSRSRTATLKTAIAAPETYGRLAAAGDAVLDGRLVVEARHPAGWADVLTGASVAGRFRTVDAPGYMVDYLPDAVRLTP